MSLLSSIKRFTRKALIEAQSSLIGKIILPPNTKPPLWQNYTNCYLRNGVSHLLGDVFPWTRVSSIYILTRLKIWYEFVMVVRFFCIRVYCVFVHGRSVLILTTRALKKIKLDAEDSRKNMGNFPRSLRQPRTGLPQVVETAKQRGGNTKHSAVIRNPEKSQSQVSLYEDDFTLVQGKKKRLRSLSISLQSPLKNVVVNTAEQQNSLGAPGSAPGLADVVVSNSKKRSVNVPSCLHVLEKNLVVDEIIVVSHSTIVCYLEVVETGETLVCPVWLLLQFGMVACVIS